MEYLIALIVLVIGVGTIGYMVHLHQYKLREQEQMNTVKQQMKERKDLSELRQAARKAELDRQAVRNALPVKWGGVPTSSEVQSFTKSKQVQTVGNNSIGIQSGGSIQTSTLRPSTRPTVFDNSDDMLTTMILQNAINRQSNITSGTVSWIDNVPTITETPAPVESSYSSSYSSPSSSYSSSSSSDSDSSSRSSYSSSYSSSSDSSSSSDYSSSSSDSSSFSSD